MIEPDGFFRHIAALLGAKLEYLRARVQLAGLEGREAAIHLAVLVGLAIGAVVVAIFGYLFFVIAIVFLVAWACGGGNAWIWVLLGAALVHFIGAGALALIAKARLAAPLFPATLDEFKKDQVWLKTTANRT
jgi:uncharacterized membrane protein YqjE